MVSNYLFIQYIIHFKPKFVYNSQKISIKTLSGDLFQIEAEGSDQVRIYIDNNSLNLFNLFFFEDECS
jgi:hypothetical protein